MAKASGSSSKKDSEADKFEISEPKKSAVLQQLQKTPIVQLACERAGVGRATYYRWRAKDDIFARAADRALEAGRFLANDLIEASLILKAKQGDGPSQRFWLQNNHPQYSKKEIHEHCHVCDHPSREEQHRIKRYTERIEELRKRSEGRNIPHAETMREIQENFENLIMWRFGLLDDISDEEFRERFLKALELMELLDKSSSFPNTETPDQDAAK